MPTIDFIYFDAGGGHRAAATALKAVIEQQQRPWTVRMVNLQEVLDPLDVFRKVTTIRLEDIYNLLLKKGWTLGSAQMLKFMHGVIRVYHRPAVNLLKGHWKATKPDLVVSLVPNFNRAMCESLRATLPSTPYVTVLTDLADYPPHFWIERQPQYFVCGSERAYEQAVRAGHPADRVFRASGMILRPKFYEAAEVDRRAERLKLGLDPDRPTGIVLFGGQGSGVMLKIAGRIAAARLEVQLIHICGRNDKLAARLRALRSPLKMHVEGFTSEIPHYMRLADFLIGKPGPGSISEAVAMKLPVIIERNRWTLPQERYNADWVIENGAGIVLPSFREIARGVEELLAPGALDRYRANVERIENRAVFEIPDILARLLQ
jgi:1,2-diacylglycerol 3-beta-galactosyltransferase